MGIAASKSGPVSATTFLHNSTSIVNSTFVSASSASVASSSAAVASSTSSVVTRNSSVSSLLSFSLSSVGASSTISEVNRVSSVSSPLPSSLSSVALSTPASSSVSEISHPSSIQEIVVSSSQAVPSPSNGTSTSAQLSSQSIATSTSAISKVSMSSSTSSTKASSSASSDLSGSTSDSSTSASSTASAAVASSSGRSSASSSSALSNPTSSSQADLTSNSGSSTQSTQETANGILIPSSTPSSSNDSSKDQSSTSSTSSGQPSGSENGGQVSANSAGTTGAAKSTVEAITTETFPSSTLTSTVLVTSRPASTLSIARGITVSSDGHLSTTFPALITLVSTSTNANGAETIWTSIVANPTDQVSGDVADDHSFLHNEGAVAGVFTVVGIAFTAAITAIFLLCRRRRQRKSRRRQWIDNIQKRLPAPEDPFENPRDAPVMRSMSQTSRNEHHYQFQSPSPVTERPFSENSNIWDHDDNFRSPPEGTILSNSLGLTSIDASRMGPLSDSPYGHQEQIGIAVTTCSPPAHQSRPSLAQSSPSIYPPSIPLPNDNASVYEDIDLMSQDDQPVAQAVTKPYVYPSEVVAGPPSPISPGDGPFDDLYSFKPLKPTPVAANSGYYQPPVASPVPRASTAPLRPARSILREKTPSKVIDQALVTPPPSLSGHGHEDDQEGANRDADSPSPSATSGLSSSEAVPHSSTASDTNQKQRPRSASKSIDDIVMRKTLLNVRPRSRDNVQNSAGSGRM